MSFAHDDDQAARVAVLQPWIHQQFLGRRASDV